ncbi:MAG: DUF4234 domain-containing protein [Stomatobaculum sp.]|nr:DUF4234 domain-containing protein [Stomatobaculum sp.]
MYCKYCGARLAEGSPFCGECGRPVTPDAPAGQTARTVRGPLRTDRSFLKYLLFTFLTCGLYGHYYLYYLAQDMNQVLESDGRSRLGSLGEFIGYSLLSGGVYGSCWYFTLANRMKINAPRYGLQIDDDGTSILLWSTIGTLLCFIGPFVAVYKIMNNANRLCEAYNRSCGF